MVDLGPQEIFIKTRDLNNSWKNMNGFQLEQK